MIELTQLRYFVKLAEVLNFTEAAKQLFITQSTLSQSIAKMEGELGVPLFDRIGHKLYVSEAGSLFLPNALQTLRDADEGMQKLRDMQHNYTSELRVGVTHSLTELLIKVLPLFCRQYPLVKVSVYYSTTIGEMVDRVKNRKVDFAVTYRPHLLESSVESEEMFHSPLCAVTAHNHPFSQRTSLSLEEVSGCELILPSRGLLTRTLLDDLARRHRVALNPMMEINDIGMIIKLLQQGTWVSVLTGSSIVEDASLKVIPLKERSGLMRASLLWPKGGYKKQVAKELAAMLLACEQNHDRS